MTPSSNFISVSNPSQLEIIKAVAGVAAVQNVEAAIVGGFIRDSLLGRPVRDLDLAIEGNGRLFAEALAAKLGASMFILHSEAGMYRITLTGQAFDQIDVSEVDGNLGDDLMRRDFTVDAMGASITLPALNNNQMEIVDPSNGLVDIGQKILRAVSPDVFKSDPARLLRGVRLAAELGFTIESATERLIAENAALCENVAGERTREDLVKLFSLPSAGPAIEYLDRLGLLTRIFPELEPSRGVDQPIEHSWDVLGHQMKTVEALDWVLRRGYWPYAPTGAQELVPWTRAVQSYFESGVNSGASRIALTRLAALIHDIAKPETKTQAPNGRVRFYGHPARGAETAVSMLSRLRFSQREIKFVAAMVELHMRPTQMGPDSIQPTPKAVYRFHRDAGDAAVATLYLSLADHLAARGPTLQLDNFAEHVKIVAYVLSERERQKSKEPQRLIDGNELQSRFGLKPGPELGKILDEIVEAQATGEISTREEGLELAKRLIEAAKS
ncbi:CCA tRNA nucleotidyltransferase [Dehalogenimonas etheniformans]|uniref:HD domain-containing protein n=1 Tax=Dehalogenimonas etheniformans TaxID=1536648 RepID=A0A2P5P6T4_9CHLR|nr:HD domain-containing protein [Dehalogenimonas etheniformans]PPD58000.1 HD domain-containing protein [Dehalogenimonas etheniformans]QNT75349.1 HD domain-containing protein [Dehalogenimonas etheniformans]